MVKAARVLVVPDASAHPLEIVAPRSLWEPLGLAPGQWVQLRAGQNSLRIRVAVPHPSDGRRPSPEGRTPVVQVHPSTLSQLSIPSYGLPSHMKVVPGGPEPVVQIGPFVGVLGQRGGGRTPFGPHELYFRFLSAFGRPLGIPTYIFSARDVDWNQKVVRGFQWRQQGRFRGWYRDKFPLPDVVFDRLLSRRAEWRPWNQALKKRFLSLPDVTYFNPGFFDKWTVHSQLAEAPELAPYLPATERLESLGDLRAFLRRYPNAFLKPTGGSLGLGILAIRRRGERYRLVASTRAGTIHRRFHGFAALARWLSRYIRNREYVVQQGISLARWGGRPFDLRILMQKDTGGQWEMTKGYARVAPPGSLTSNLSSGGTAVRLGRVLRSVFGRSRGQSLVNTVVALVYRLAPAIEGQIGGAVGELGLDLGIDRRGRIWILEVNSKPFLQVTPGSGTPQAIRLSVIRPLRWSRYVAGFEPEGVQATRRAPGTISRGATQQVAAARQQDAR